MLLAILVTSRRRKIPRRVTLGVLALLLVLSGVLWARPIETKERAPDERQIRAQALGGTSPSPALSEHLGRSQLPLKVT